MAQQVRALALPEEPSSAPRNDMAAPKHLLTSVPENPTSSWVLCGHQT